MTKEELLIYQWKNWEIILKEDANNETIWANLNQISELFDRDKSVISRHIKNVFNSWELSQEWVVAKIATTASDWKTYNVDFYNLDMIISIWYRVDSKKATEFRKWATKTLKEHIINWYTINPKRIEANKDKFLQAVDDVVKILWDNVNKIETNDVLELVKSFANTWFSLESYDEDKLPTNWFTTKDLKVNSDDLYKDISDFKKVLIDRKEATELFAQEKIKKSLEWILWNVFQTFNQEDLYPTIEEKAAHLLYFIVKNHPFIDWNKRTWAFSFIWFLQRIWYNFREKITPEALTVITLLAAESNPKDKNRIVGLIILLLKK